MSRVRQPRLARAQLLLLLSLLLSSWIARKKKKNIEQIEGSCVFQLSDLKDAHAHFRDIIFRLLILFFFSYSQQTYYTLGRVLYRWVNQWSDHCCTNSHAARCGHQADGQSSETGSRRWAFVRLVPRTVLSCLARQSETAADNFLLFHHRHPPRFQRSKGQRRGICSSTLPFSKNIEKKNKNTTCCSCRDHK